MFTMNRRLFENSNLTLHTSNLFQGQPVLDHKGPLAENYLERIQQTLDYAFNEYPRICAIRFDLRFPMFYFASDSDAISKFTASLKAQIKANLKRKRKEGMCNLRYIWVKEQELSDNPHYHVVILLNGNVYNSLGNFKISEDNMASRIVNAWASALGLHPNEVRGKVNFPNNCLYQVNKNKITFCNDYSSLFQRLSYLAKIDTKKYFGGSNNFGSSRK